MAKLRRLCKSEYMADGENYIDVSRPNIFGNPYTHIKNKKTLALVVVKDREEAVNAYSKYFDDMLKLEGRSGDKFRAEWNRIIELYDKYDYLYFMCYCKPEESCHADIVMDKLRRYMTKKKVSEALERKKS